MPEPKEPRIRTAFNIVAAVAGVFGFGIEMGGHHPYIGMPIIAAALCYGTWELFTSPVATKKLPVKVRIVFVAILFFIGVGILAAHP